MAAGPGAVPGRVVACCQAFRRSVCPGAFLSWLRVLGLLAGRGGAGAGFGVWRSGVGSAAGVPWPLALFLACWRSFGRSRGRWACWRPASRAGASRVPGGAGAGVGVRRSGCRSGAELGRPVLGPVKTNICSYTGPGVSCGINGAGCVGSGFGAICPGAPERGQRAFPAYTPLFNFFLGTLLPLKISYLTIFHFSPGENYSPALQLFPNDHFFASPAAAAAFRFAAVGNMLQHRPNAAPTHFCVAAARPSFALLRWNRNRKWNWKRNTESATTSRSGQMTKLPPPMTILRRRRV